MENLVGQTIKHYQLEAVAGSGSHGIVYRAIDTNDGSTVAIKIILPQYVDNEKLLQRLEIEVDILRKLNHPRIVTLHDYWKDEMGICMVMTWLGGGNLRRLMEQEGALSLERVADLLNHIADALSVAHAADIVHRDLKPENIMLDSAGNPYLTDFSIAKRLNYTSITTSGMVLGSPRYLTPEQILSDPITPRTDVCALGIVTHEMLAGEYAFDDTTTELQLILKLAQAVLPPLYPEYSEAVDDVIQQATSKNTEKRYVTVRDFAVAFSQAAGLRAN
ncbi:MAG: serine/threonine-protein kinase [Aggregatilineales bacterium]